MPISQGELVELEAIERGIVRAELSDVNRDQKPRD
jgi:hypothetical protein